MTTVRSVPQWKLMANQYRPSQTNSVNGTRRVGASRVAAPSMLVLFSVSFCPSDGVADLAAEYLPHGALRQGRNDLDPARNLVGREALTRQLQQFAPHLPGIIGHTVLEHHLRDQQLAPHLVVHAGHRGFLDLGVLEEDLLDFARVHLEPADD